MILWYSTYVFIDIFDLMVILHIVLDKKHMINSPTHIRHFMHINIIVNYIFKQNIFPVKLLRISNLKSHVLKMGLFQQGMQIVTKLQVWSLNNKFAYKSTNTDVWQTHVVWTFKWCHLEYSWYFQGPNKWPSLHFLFMYFENLIDFLIVIV